MSILNIHRHLGFTLTELMVVIVILCCLATWVPMAWLTPDKPKDLKAIEHLRAHVYLHNAFFSMFRRYPQLLRDVPPFPEDKANYQRLVLQKNPAVNTNLGVSGISFLGLSFSVSFPTTDGDASGLNQLTQLRENDPNFPIVSFQPIDWGAPNPLADESCQKNSPIVMASSFLSDETKRFCKLDTEEISSPVGYRTIAVGPGDTTLPTFTGAPAMFDPINGEDVMISHRCLGVVGPSDAIYIFHVAGGETIASAHIPSQVVRKSLITPILFAKQKLLVAALFACEDSERDIDQVINDSGDAGLFNFTDITPLPGF